jgi:hypothetical protein
MGILDSTPLSPSRRVQPVDRSSCATPRRITRGSRRPPRNVPMYHLPGPHSLQPSQRHTMYHRPYQTMARLRCNYASLRFLDQGPASTATTSKAMFDHISCSTPPASINTEITNADYKEFFGKWTESTSISQDRHLGHWKALISHTATDDYPEESYKIINVIVAQLNLSLTHGYTWNRWKRILLAKIPKRACSKILSCSDWALLRL